MKLVKSLFIAVVILSSLGCKSQASISRIEIVQPTVEQEATSVWRTINDIEFFEDQGYDIHLPKDSLIDSLILKSKGGTFGNEDYTAIFTLLETHAFDKSNYVQAIQKTENQLDLLNGFIARIDATKNEWNWDFNMFDSYKIVFTLYGTGGSYDPDNGTITLLTTKDGNFMNYENPANTIIHEITHMGMEYSIVQRYDLPHELKERIVDIFVELMFKEELPEYKIQNMGDVKIDEFLKEEEDLVSLDSIVSQFTNQ